MNYAHITEDVSHAVRDASYDLNEDRHLQIMEDPHQPWSVRSRTRDTDDQDVVNSMLDLC